MPLPTDVSRDFIGKKLQMKADLAVSKFIGNAQSFSAEKNWMLRTIDFPEIDKEIAPVVIKGK